MAPEPPPVPGSASEKQLIDRLTCACETGDVDAIIALFAGDAWLTVPPAPLEYQGRDPIARFLTAISFRDGRTYRLVPTRANGQLAFGACLRGARPDAAQANSLLVLTLTGSRIQAMTRFDGKCCPLRPAARGPVASSAAEDLKAGGAVLPYRLDMARKQPTPEDAAAARRILLDGGTPR